MKCPNFALLAIVLCVAGRGSTLTYGIVFDASGSLNGTPFTDATIAVSFAADGSPVQPFSLGFAQTGAATVSINGGSEESFPGQADVFVEPGIGILGFSIPGGDIVDVFNAAFDAYDLSAAAGPVLTQVVNFSSPLTTTAGTLNLDIVSDSGLFIAFEGTSNATPEPGSFALFGGGAAFLGFRRVRKTARMVKKLMPPGHSNSIIRQGVACGRCVDPQVASGSALQTGTGFLCPDVGAPNDNARPTRRRPA